MSSSTMKTVTPHFFKIVRRDNILHQKLAIPKKFQRVYGENLSEEVILRVPSGKEWTIQLVEDNEDLWLQGGWVEFAEFYSLAHGCLIVFEFEGDGIFQILIFDQSASEIDYPCLTSHDQGDEDRDGNSESDVEQVTSADFSAINSNRNPRAKRRENSRSLWCRSSKRLKTNAGETRSRTENGHKHIPEGGERDVTRTKNKSTINENDKTFEKPESEYPSFSVSIQPINLRKRSILDLPPDFARKHLSKGDGDAIIRISDNSTWSVKYSCEVSRENPRAKFYNGWSTFAKDNNLKVGDVCVFKLIQNTKIIFSVRISPKAEDTSSRQGAIKKVNHKRTNEPEIPANHLQFVKEINKNNMKYIICLPSEFAKGTGLVSMRTVTLKDVTRGGCGGEWTVEVKKEPDNRVRLTSGWNKFFTAKGLSIGDACLFKFVDGSLHVRVLS